MSGIIFALFASSILLIYSTIHTWLQTAQHTTSVHEKRKWRAYGVKLASLSLLTLLLAIWLFLQYY